MKISWIFDVISPFAYLSLKQLAQLPPQAEVEFVPVLLAAILDHHGQLGPAEMPTKRRFTYRFALWRGRKLGINMQMPPTHPFNPLAADRLIIAAGCSRRAVETVFDAVFRDGLDVADTQVIERLALELGVSGPGALNDPTVKQRLRDNTQWAIAQGVFGVPTFLIGKELFWGHDSFGMLLDYVHDPRPFDDDRMQAIDSLPVGVQRMRAPKPR